MAQSLTQIYTHIIFSTQNRENILCHEDLQDIHAYLGGIINNNNCNTIIIGGISDHVHILCKLSSTTAIATLLQEVKRSSSKWIKQKSPVYKDFAWQNGYAAFSVSQSKVEIVRNYIANQEAHHHKQTFKEELIEFLNNYQVEYDPEYLWT